MVYFLTVLAIILGAGSLIPALPPWAREAALAVCALSVLAAIWVKVGEAFRQWRLRSSPSIGWIEKHPIAVQSGVVLTLLLLMVAAAPTVHSWVVPAGHPSKVVITKIEPHEMTPGQPLRINFYYRFDGPGTVIPNVLVYARAAVVTQTRPDKPARAAEAQEEIWKAFRANVMNPTSPQAAPIGAPIFSTVIGPQLSEDYVANLKAETATAYLVGLIRWRDEAGAQEYEFCYFTQTDPRVVFFCQRHNGPPVSSRG